MKVIVGRIHRYVHRHPGNDRYGCERYPVSEPPRSDEAGRKRLHGSRTDVTCLFLAGKTEPGGASRRVSLMFFRIFTQLYPQEIDVILRESSS